MADIVWFQLHVESKKYNKLGSEYNNNNKKADSHIQRKDQWLPVGREKVGRNDKGVGD